MFMTHLVRSARQGNDMTAPEGERAYTPEPLLPFHAIENMRYLYLALPANIVTLLCIFPLGINSEVFEALPVVLFFLIPIMVISAIRGIIKLGGEFYNPLVATVACSLPLSLWENINQRNNGCLSFGFPGESGCPPEPPGYELPRTVMIVFQMAVMVLAAGALQSKNWKGMYAFMYASYLSFMIYMYAYISGLFG